MHCLHKARAVPGKVGWHLGVTALLGCSHRFLHQMPTGPSARAVLQAAFVTCEVWPWIYTHSLSVFIPVLHSSQSFLLAASLPFPRSLAKN